MCADLESPLLRVCLTSTISRLTSVLNRFFPEPCLWFDAYQYDRVRLFNEMSFRLQSMGPKGLSVALPSHM